MRSFYKVGPNYEIPLPDEMCDELNISIGDILIFKAVAHESQVQVLKHDDQALSDAEIEDAGNLSRVIPLIVEE